MESEVEVEAEARVKAITITKTKARAEDKTITKAKTKTDTDTDTDSEDITSYSRKNNCVCCGETIRIKKSLKTHEKIHCRANLESSDIFNITSSFNHRQLYINRLHQDYNTDISEAVSYFPNNIITYKS